MLHATGGGEPENVYAIGDLDADGVPVRVYRPSAEDNLPVVVYFHGGGWTIGSVDVYDTVTRAAGERRATRSSCRSTTGWRPSTRIPAPLDDCWTALEWVAEQHRRSSAVTRHGSPSPATAPAATSRPSSR